MSDVEVAALRQVQLDQAAKLSWAPAIGNGTTILALTNLISNVEHPDLAFEALRWPISCFAFGAVLGIGACWGFSLDLRAREAELRIRAWISSAEEVRGRNRDDERGRTEGGLAEAKVLHADTKTMLNQTGKLSGWTNLLSLVALAVGYTVLMQGHHMGSIKLEPVSHSQPPITAPPAPAPR